MKFLVTGGTGFIGQALCASLTASSHEVTVLTRDPVHAQAILPPRVHCVARLDQVGAIDTVVNLQGEPLAAGRWNARRKAEFIRSRVDFTRELVGWMQRQARPPATLINGSAIGWYGDRGDEALDESAQPGNGFAAQLCRDWESEAQRSEGFGVRVCRLRIGVVLDCEGGALAKMLPAFRLGGGGMLGSGTQWMSWITRHDLVRLIRWLAENPGLSGVFNGTAPNPVTNRAFAQQLGRALRRPTLLPMPALVLRALFGEMATLLLGSQRVLPRAAMEGGFKFEQADLGTALAQLLGRTHG